MRDDMPADFSARLSSYRDVVARQSLLIVLDDARWVPEAAFGDQRGRSVVDELVSAHLVEIVGDAYVVPELVREFAALSGESEVADELAAGAHAVYSKFGMGPVLDNMIFQL